MGRENMANAGLTGLVRLVKRWIKLETWPENECPNSYCMELVMLQAHNEVGEHGEWRVG